MSKLGIDISEHQGKIDFDKAAKKIDFVIIRDGYGKGTVDKTAVANIAGFKAAGVPILGLYHFSYALTIEDAVNEAKFAVNIAKQNGLPENTVIFFDLEYGSVDYAKRNGITIGKPECIVLSEAFCEEVKRLGYKPGIYYNQDYHNNMYNDATLSKYVRWLADYEGDPNYPCDIQQYSSKGRIDGIYADVDLNRLFSTSLIKMEEKRTYDVDAVAREVIAGKYGNGETRKKNLAAAGYDYTTVQNRVDELLKASKPVDVDSIAKDVIAGKYGNGEERKKKLAAAGYDYATVQKRVDEMLKTSKSNGAVKVTPASDFNKQLSGAYSVSLLSLPLSAKPGSSSAADTIAKLSRGNIVNNYGYFTTINGVIWLYVAYGNVTGWVSTQYVNKK